ncbi:respiratory nitrate reductase subunit gamma [Pilimelia columellifera]|uniref:Respiratory nitrate reductase subunit gamma n=1 Tax=Pilimelia columellifera subsp. columellifera TaxID=706583 RepID=A0ABN3NI80_9ACTN
MNTLLWVVFPYLAIATLIGGTIWRHRYDKFGWTTRSSQLYESAVLRWGSPLFHFGIIFVVLGHFSGLVIPKSWTEGVGITEHAYHLTAVFVGTFAGVCTVIGLAILILRRRLTGPVFAATTKNDKTMYVLLGGAIVIGLWATAKANILGDGYDYRETISPWFRSLFVFQPRPELMADVPLSFQIHVLSAFLLFAFWPFTRLVHAFSAPIGYTTRPYVVYRSRDTPSRTGLRAARPGWEGPPKRPVKSGRS